MSRSVLTDLLQVYPFWILDVAPIDPLALPLLTPIFGFSGLTSPEITIETMDITEGNWFFKRKIVKTGDVSNITMERGIVFYDSDFYRWTMGALQGDLSNSKFGIPGTPANIKIGGITPRRTLLLVQFFTRMPTSLPEGSDVILQTGLAAAGAALAGQNVSAVGTAAVQGALFGLLSHFGPFEFTARLPAKAWLLHGTIPVRYKSGSDFDALSSAISIQQLEVAVEMMEEVSLLA